MLQFWVLSSCAEYLRNGFVESAGIALQQRVIHAAGTVVVDMIYQFGIALE